MSEGKVSADYLLNSFYSIFRGNPLFFIKHQIPFTKVGNKLKAKWCGFSVYSEKNVPPKGCEEGDLVPLTIERYREHLNGGNGLAVSPILNVTDAEGSVIKRNVCYFAVIDIDVYDVDYTSLINNLNKYGFQFVPVLSKSGGLHLYFFFREAEPASKVIEALSRIVEVFGLNRLYVSNKQKSKVEIFPKQATFVPGERNANCIFLPFYGNKHNKIIFGNKLIGIDKAFPIIDSKFTTVSEINEVLNNLPYNDAPFCIQMVLLTSALGENDGRNNFLFSAAIYLKNKYEDNFLDSLIEMNNCLEAPLDDKEITSIYKSVTDKKRNFESFSCKKSPCVDYCDKKLCKEREYSPGRDKGGHYTGAGCWGLIRRVVDTKGNVQYYLWDIQPEEGGEFKTVCIDDVSDFENQSKIRTNCRRDLHWSPNVVSTKKWVAITNHAMQDIKARDITIAKGTETSEDSLFRNAVYRYLTHKQIQNRQPFLIKTGQVYKNDGYYYFTTDGVLRYLNLEKISIHKLNIHVKLTDLECEEAEIVHKTSRGLEIKIPCWKKKEDEELRDMDIFYEDIYEGDMDILYKSANKEVSDGDIKF